MTATRPLDDSTSVEPAFLWTLRLGVACCFIGHGSLGLNQTAAWTSYFGVAGISHEHALGLMPWVGTFDWLMGFSVLFAPARAVVGYMVAWCAWTALLRPLAGESAWEFVERAGNYGAPLALLLVFAPGRGFKGWFRGHFRETLDAARTQAVSWVLRLTTSLLLLGHGMLNASVCKTMFVTQYSFLGLPGQGATTWIGAFECVLAVAVLFRPARGLLAGVLAWKLASEALCPMTGSPLWVFVEHGGSYAAPLALLFLQTMRARRASVVSSVPTTA
jgi:hypothetical protein